MHMSSALHSVANSDASTIMEHKNINIIKFIMNVSLFNYCTNIHQSIQPLCFILDLFIFKIF